MRSGYIGCLAIVSAMLIASCDRFSSPDSGAAVQREEEKRLQDQKDRAALVEKMKAAALEQEKKREPIKQVQKKIDLLDEQITDAQRRGRDWRPLEKQQEALEAEKKELEKQLR